MLAQCHFARRDERRVDGGKWHPAGVEPVAHAPEQCGTGGEMFRWLSAEARGAAAPATHWSSGLSMFHRLRDPQIEYRTCRSAAPPPRGRAAPSSKLGRQLATAIQKYGGGPSCSSIGSELVYCEGEGAQQRWPANEVKVCPSVAHSRCPACVRSTEGSGMQAADALELPMKLECSGPGAGF
ncbi:hypothetical protein BP5796_06725 [Coleophoma crateriformis]|uniref:Uncharacterized protein n=1 Tax=Coleophoma crateriformis TaxID=565419 RepID=A0A3D8RPV0_9HELO|nr:hypothetical protein BP5796_06725 [Coleophoma crateriformis]